MKPKQTILSILTLILLVILLQNTQVVHFNLLFWTISMSQIVLLVIVILVSFAAGYLVSSLIRKRKKQTEQNR